TTGMSVMMLTQNWGLLPMNQVTQLSTQVANLPALSSPPLPPFAGELNKCRGFLLQCGLVFQQKPQSFSTESAKVHYVLGLLRGRALVWAEAVCTDQHLQALSFEGLSTKLRTVLAIRTMPEMLPGGC
uniref:DUF4939 domain-containing protein n=1 Tax=Scophthalmus maximus TaxID=52904 RepID=A0A8D3CDT3_SCOMX